MISILCLIARPPAIHEGAVTRMTPSWNYVIVVPRRKIRLPVISRIISSNFFIENRRARAADMWLSRLGDNRNSFLLLVCKKIFARGSRRERRRKIYLHEASRIYGYTETSCKLDRWYHPARSSHLSIRLSLVSSCLSRRTNNNESNEAKSRSERYVRSQPPRNIRLSVEKCRTKSLYLLLFLVGRFRSENCDPFLRARTAKALPSFLSPHFLSPLAACRIVYIRRIAYRTRLPLCIISRT